MRVIIVLTFCTCNQGKQLAVAGLPRRKPHVAGEYGGEVFLGAGGVVATCFCVCVSPVFATGEARSDQGLHWLGLGLFTGCRFGPSQHVSGTFAFNFCIQIVRTVEFRSS